MARDEEAENLEEEHGRLVREMEEKGWTEPPWQTFMRTIVRDAGPYLVAPVVLGLIASLLTDFGGSIEPQLYETVAQIAPVVVLATLAAQFFAMRPILTEVERRVRDPGARRLFLTEHLTREAGLFLLVESTALIGVALGYSTTFLAVTMLVALIGLVVSFVKAQYDYFFMGVHVKLPAEGSSDEESGSGSSESAGARSSAPTALAEADMRPERGLHWWGGFIRPLIVTTMVPLSVTPIIAFAVSLVSDFGRNVNADYYLVLGLTLPVIALLAFRERAWVYQAFKAEREADAPDDEKHDLLGMNWAGTLCLALNFVIGEAAALYALGSDNSSTFLCMLSAVSLVVLFGVFVRNHLARYVPPD